MTQTAETLETELDEQTPLSRDARSELNALGITDLQGHRKRSVEGFDPTTARPLIPRQAISASGVLNEAFDYRPLPSAFSRGVRVELPGASMLFLSGTASVDERGRTVYEGDFKAQCLRTFRNLTSLLASEDATWHDIVRTTCYLRDIERDYDAFNEMRTLFLKAAGVDPLPASTGIQARLCRSDLLVEIEAIAMIACKEGK